MTAIVNSLSPGPVLSAVSTPAARVVAGPGDLLVGSTVEVHGLVRRIVAVHPTRVLWETSIDGRFLLAWHSSIAEARDILRGAA